MADITVTGIEEVAVLALRDLTKISNPREIRFGAATELLSYVQAIRQQQLARELNVRK